MYLSVFASLPHTLYPSLIWGQARYLLSTYLGADFRGRQLNRGRNHGPRETCAASNTALQRRAAATQRSGVPRRRLMVVVRVRCEREGGCVRLTALGLLAGCMIGALLELLQGPRPVVSAVQPEHSARALSLGGQPGRDQGVQSRSAEDGAGPQWTHSGIV